MQIREAKLLTIRSEGGLLPADILNKLTDRNPDLAGGRPEDYGYLVGDRLNEHITQSWNQVRKHWSEFRKATVGLCKTASGTALTNNYWNLPLLRELGFGLLPTSTGPEIGGRRYAISRFYGSTPVHLIGCNLSLDRRTAGHRGAAASSPHGLVQEFLNRSDAHLWAVLSNGLHLRILRDNQAMSRQSFLEFDLGAMMDGELYYDFIILWRVAHASRFAPRCDGRAETCWLELWAQEAEKRGIRALGELRNRVERALVILGEGFVGNPKNTALREVLQSGQLSATGLHTQLLRIIYRLIFLFVAEDRTLDGQSLIHPLASSEAACKRYAKYYSTNRLRLMANKIKGGRHADLWRQFQLITHALSGEDESRDVRQALALPAFGSFLWRPDATVDLNDTTLNNFCFLESIRHLAFIRRGKVLRSIDYKNLGAEELGGIYESLLGLTPQVSGGGARFSFAEFTGSERRTSGSYYTSDNLVQRLLDSALDPVVQEAIKDKSPTAAEEAILQLKVCDPAAGSGHFLVGAAHRLARELARVRAFAQGETEPSPLVYQHAVRDVIGRCLYGVDMSLMAVELCRFSLWLEALEPGKPLSFLGHHIRVGNSLLGVTSELIAKGLPNGAFKHIKDDDKNFCSQLRKRNKQERDGRQKKLELTTNAETRNKFDTLASRSRVIDQAPDDNLDEVVRKSSHFDELIDSPEYLHQKSVADAWCAAFVWPKNLDAPAVVTTDTIWMLEEGIDALNEEQRVELKQLTERYQFFHWQLAFPEVFAQGGFDVVLGNPPWKMNEVKDQEYFSGIFPEILSVKSAKDKAGILSKIHNENFPLWAAYQQYVDVTLRQRLYLAESGRFPLASFGRMNLYRLFLELGHTSLKKGGRIGFVIPSGFASDSFSQKHFLSLHGKGRIISLYDFENRGNFFSDVHRSQKFCLLTVGDDNSCKRTDFVFYANSLADLDNEDRHVRLSSDDAAFFSPITKTAPLFKTKSDHVLTRKLQQAGPIIGESDAKGGWQIKTVLMFMMNASMKGHRSSDELETAGCKLSGNVYECEKDRWVPLYEGKMVGMFDHRAASIRFNKHNRVRRNQPVPLTFKEHADPTCLATPMFWIDTNSVIERCSEIPRWALSVKDVTSATNERTCIAAILPNVALTSSLPWLSTTQAADTTACLLANLNSFIFDYIARQKVAGVHLQGHYLNQLPVLDTPTFDRPLCWLTSDKTSKNWIVARVIELSYTAWDLKLFANDAGWDGPPFQWNDDRRFLIRCELDAAFFHFYMPSNENGEWRLTLKGDGYFYNDTPEQLEELTHYFQTPRDAVIHVMDTFSIICRRDNDIYGDYRTKKTILDIYDAMQEAFRSGCSYQTTLDPLPGPPVGANNRFVRYASIAENHPSHVLSPRIS